MDSRKNSFFDPEKINQIREILKKLSIWFSISDSKYSQNFRNLFIKAYVKHRRSKLISSFPKI
jgi:hypothetical protein